MASFTSKKINVKDMAIGAVAMSVLLCVPKVGDAIASAIGTVRNKIGGR